MRMRPVVLMLVMVAVAVAAVEGAAVRATRFSENPLITLKSSPLIGDNANGPTVIRVPSWVPHPLGRYYMYFAHHTGTFIRLAYADSLHGPWKVYDGRVLGVEETALYRPQPDPPDNPPGVYTHVASPEVYVDEARHRLVLWVHGMWTDGQRWPEDRAAASRWVREHGYAQFTQVGESGDGLHFRMQPAITKQSYLRVFQHDGAFYAIARLGQLLRATDPLQPFELGDSPFAGTRYVGKVRHVALLPEGRVLHVYFSFIGDAPERINHTTIDLSGDWKSWRIGPVEEVLAPDAPYECPDLPSEPSAVGEIDHPARQLRDPAIIRDGGRTYLFYTFCGEQGIAAAELSSSR